MSSRIHTVSIGRRQTLVYPHAVTELMPEMPIREGLYCIMAHDHPELAPTIWPLASEDLAVFTLDRLFSGT